MADYDYSMGGSPPPEESGSAYPDIDETLHYPWQDSQQLNAQEVPASVIDPRLYQGPFPQNGAENPEEYREAEEDGVSEVIQAYPPDLDGVDMGDNEDSDFIYTEDESER